MPRNVTLACYQGQDDGDLFLEDMVVLGMSDETVVEKFGALLQEIEEYQAQVLLEWEDHDYGEVVTETAQEGELTVETAYRVYADGRERELVKVERRLDGVLHGMSEVYDGNGELYRTTPYENGAIQGIETHYSDTDALIGTREYVNDEQHGLEIWYTEEGELRLLFEWSGGARHGRDVGWHDDGQPYQFFHWDSGKQDGLCVHYIDEGDKISSGAEYRDGVVVRELPYGSPVTDLPAEYQPAALAVLREEHRRVDPAE